MARIANGPFTFNSSVRMIEIQQSVSFGFTLMAVLALVTGWDAVAKYDFIYGCAVVKFKNKEKRIHLQKEYSSFYDLIKRTINHQSTFINKKVFEKHGLYDENLRIVSDWKFFLETIGIHKCTSKYINQNIIIFDPNGISFTNVSLREEERKQVLNQILPSFVIEDYLSHFQFNELLNQKITKKIVGILYRATIYLENKKIIRKS